MGLFSFLFGKKKNKANEEQELKRITTFEITECNKANDEPEVVTPVQKLTREAIAEETTGEISARKIASDINESDHNVLITEEKPEERKTKSKVPIEIGEDIVKNDDNLKQNQTKVKLTQKKKQQPQSKNTHEINENDAALQTNQVSTNARVGRFEIKKTKDSRFVFNLYASNHVIVATSQIYSSPQSALIGIRSIIANAEKSPIEDITVKNYTSLPFPKWEIYLDKSEHFRFRLYATNGSCVVHSQGYTSKANCKKGIESIVRCAPTAEIDKSYLKKAVD